MNFMTTIQFKVPDAAKNDVTWGFDLDVIPHPVAFGALTAFDSQGANSADTPILNSQLSGTIHRDKYTSWIGFAQRWRPTYMSITLYQDGAALTNQGTIQACQRPVHEMKLYSTVGKYTTGALTSPKAVEQMIAFNPGDRTSFATVSNMPNAYIGQSRDGCYMPLIMTSTCQKWHGQHDQCTLGSGSNRVIGEGYPLLSTSGGLTWPFWGLAETASTSPQDGNVLAGSTTSRAGSDIWGLICARNLDVTTSFTAVFRVGYEIQCQPGTIMTPQLHISPAYDPKAIAAYFAIRREMKDAYPADYNDWAKIWKVIKDVAGVVLPGVGMMGPIGAGVAAAGRGAVSAVDAITEAFRKKAAPVEQGRNPMPLAAKERAQELAKAVAVTQNTANLPLRFKIAKKKKAVRMPKRQLRK